MNNIVSYDELVRAIRNILPQAEFTEDESGELLIKCGVVEDDGTVSECKRN